MRITFELVTLILIMTFFFPKEFYSFWNSFSYIVTTLYVINLYTCLCMMLPFSTINSMCIHIWSFHMVLQMMDSHNGVHFPFTSFFAWHVFVHFFIFKIIVYHFIRLESEAIESEINYELSWNSFWHILKCSKFPDWEFIGLIFYVW